MVVIYYSMVKQILNVIREIHITYAHIFYDIVASIDFYANLDYNKKNDKMQGGYLYAIRNQRRELSYCGMPVEKR